MVELQDRALTLDKLKFDINHSKTFILDAHWALYCENYLEGFHIPLVHKGLAKEIDVGSFLRGILLCFQVKGAGLNKQVSTFGLRIRTPVRVCI